MSLTSFDLDISSTARLIRSDGVIISVLRPSRCKSLKKKKIKMLKKIDHKIVLMVF